MGIETAIIIGLTVGSGLMKADAAIRKSESDANAAVDQADLAAENKGKEVRLKAARQQVSFINSGLTLDGTPMSVIQSTFNVGLEDIDQIQTNAQRVAKNSLKAGRSAAIGSLFDTASSVVGGIDFGGGSGDVLSGGTGTDTFGGSGGGGDSMFGGI